MFRSRILFFILAAVSFAIAAAFTGSVSYLIRIPANFFAALISIALLVYATVTISKYMRWPVVVFAVALLIVTMWAETPVKQMLQVGLSESALDISPDNQQNFRKTSFFKFSESTLDFEHAGEYLVDFYGEHYYYAVPVVSEVSGGKKIRFWAWCRTKRPVDRDRLHRYFHEHLDFGLRVKNISIERNMLKAVNAAAEEFGLTVHEDPIYLDWGAGKDNRPFIHKLKVMFWSFMVLVLAAMILEFIGSKRSRTDKV